MLSVALALCCHRCTRIQVYSLSTHQFIDHNRRRLRTYETCLAMPSIIVILPCLEFPRQLSRCNAAHQVWLVYEPRKNYKELGWWKLTCSDAATHSKRRASWLTTYKAVSLCLSPPSAHPHRTEENGGWAPVVGFPIIHQLRMEWRVTQCFLSLNHHHGQQTVISTWNGCYSTWKYSEHQYWECVW